MNHIRNSGRRHFIKSVSILAPVLALFPSQVLANGHARLRAGFIGLGPWGRQFLADALQHKLLDVKAVCETDKKALEASLSFFEILPDIQDYATLLTRKDIDAIIIATPWDQHYAMAKAAMLAGKHVACGPVMGTTIEEHEDIIKVSERTRRQYFTLDENNYRTDLQVVSDMITSDELGELETIHAGARYEVLQETHEGDALPYPLYPALPGYTYTAVRMEKREEDLIIRKTNPRTGLVNTLVERGKIDTILLTTAEGLEISLQAGRGEVQPVSTGFRIKGSKGMWTNLSGALYNTTSRTLTPYAAVTAQSNPVTQALHAFITAVQTPAKRTVYAAATHSLIGTLAAVSAARGGVAVPFPDFNKQAV